jgi:NADP-dependent 3-hydroxy acid dehydrogenase YdfG
MTSLDDKVAVVTGASSGIGKAIAIGLGAQGARLCIIGRNLVSLESVAEQVQAIGSQAFCYRADITVDEDVSHLMANLQKDVGRIDILVHSAGVISRGAVDAAPVEDFDLQYRTNVRGAYLLTQRSLPMLKVRAGQIVFINSSAGQNARAELGQYAATKHALKAIADSLREEVNAEGIRVLSVYLGRVASPMQAVVHQWEGREYSPESLLQPEDVASVVIDALSLPLTAEVTDISIRHFKKLRG